MRCTSIEHMIMRCSHAAYAPCNPHFAMLCIASPSVVVSALEAHRLAHDDDRGRQQRHLRELWAQQRGVRCHCSLGFQQREHPRPFTHVHVRLLPMNRILLCDRRTAVRCECRSEPPRVAEASARETTLVRDVYWIGLKDSEPFRGELHAASPLRNDCYRPFRIK